ncbi:MAG: hypothetical protein D6732_09645 [Methanobacteriota archaeon]|nr:MAG: hypothetical protein D6732_09645 [Euryarchaeota archaeon]
MSTADSSDYYTRDEAIQLTVFGVLGALLLVLIRMAIVYWSENTDQFGSLDEAGYYLFFMLIGLSIVLGIAGYLLIQFAWFVANVLIYFTLNILLGDTERQA